MRDSREPIITSLLDTDLYKLTMLQAFFHAPELRNAEAEWKFACRNPRGKELLRLLPGLQEQVAALGGLCFTAEELAWLGRFDYFTADFIAFLRRFRLDPAHVQLNATADSFELRLRGPLLQVTLFEIYLLAIISELMTMVNFGGVDLGAARARLDAKVALIKGHVGRDPLRIADFSTRRRASKAWQAQMLATLREQIPDNLAGTSNLALARELDLAPIGTMAHEWFQAWQAIGPLRDAQKSALAAWVREYRGALGIALTDCYSMDAFCRDFDREFARSYTGLRHDSGCPLAWGEQALALFAGLDLDPRAKTLVFSDGLDVPGMLDIHARFAGRANLVFGIGTKLGNDVGREPLNIVLKLVRVNGRPVAKISDAPGKSMCEDPDYLATLAGEYGLAAALRPSAEGRRQVA